MPGAPARASARERWITVCHCFAEAVRGGIPYHCLPCVKQWHPVVTNAGLGKIVRQIGWLFPLRIRSFGFSNSTVVWGSTDSVSQTFDPITASCPITVWPPSSVALA